MWRFTFLVCLVWVNIFGGSSMDKLNGENWVFFDVDGTLVSESNVNPFSKREWSSVLMKRHAVGRESGLLKIKNGNVYVLFYNPYTGDVECMRVETQHVRLLRHMKKRGRQIMVWSGNGVDYVEKVVDALALRPFVDYVMSKPLSCVDDLEPNDFITRIFLKRGTR